MSNEDNDNDNDNFISFCPKKPSSREKRSKKYDDNNFYNNFLKGNLIYNDFDLFYFFIIYYSFRIK
jgi:hypothetical protein